MRLKGMGVAALVLMLVWVTTACGGASYTPQEINEETDVCVICKMAVKDNAYATQIVTKDGQSLKFDDLGCMNEWKQQNGTDTIGAAFVRDFHSNQWIPYEQAYYAYDPSYATPMAYGVVSFEKQADAEAYIQQQGAGTLMTSEQLASHSWAVNRDMMNMDGHGHGDAHGDAHGDDGMKMEPESGHGGDSTSHGTEADGQAAHGDKEGSTDKAAGEGHHK